MPRKPLTEKEKSAVRNRAAVAMRQIMTDKGVDGVTIRGVGKEVGMSAMSLYTYFENKADMLVYIQLQAIDRLTGQLATARREANEPHRASVVLRDAFLNFCLEDPDEFALAFAATDGVMAKAAQDKMNLALEPLRELVLELLGRNVSTTEREKVVEAIWAAWFGFATLRRIGGISRTAAPPEITGFIANYSNA